MERYISNNTDRNQINLIPMSFDDMISEDNPVRVFDAFVNTLNLNQLGFKYAITKATGR
ncbi:MAG: transposase, partial [Firmicutes bacterium]|nr:transposase [Bacillota bacterium]